MAQDINSTEVISEIRGNLGIITLNRPQALNALNTQMCEAITKSLLEWRDDDNINAVLIKGDEDRSFCSGGDVVMLAQSGKARDQRAETFWRTEYALNELIKTYKKSYIALIDGITMGGGVGLSVHGKYRIAGDKTMFAMPETGIGYFPDVGGTYFLPRLGKAVGNWLGLTGARLDGATALLIGVATHYVKSETKAQLIDALTTASPNQIDAIIQRFATIPETKPLENDLAAFDQNSVIAIENALNNCNSEWAQKQLKILRSKSPFSVCFTFKAMQIGAKSDFRTAINHELNWSMAFNVTHDFYEGIRAQLIDKDRNPQWSAKTFAEVDMSAVDAIINADSSHLDFID